MSFKYLGNVPKAVSSHKQKNLAMNNKGKGLLALLGVAAGAFAFWKYKNMTPAEKQQLKDKATATGRKIRDKVEDVEDTISGKYNQLKNAAKREANEASY